MKKILLTLAILCSFSFNNFAQSITHYVNSGNYYYSPSSLTINEGDTVVWTNDGGFHNVNADINTLTGLSFNNPVTFLFFSYFKYNFTYFYFYSTRNLQLRLLCGFSCIKWNGWVINC